MYFLEDTIYLKLTHFWKSDGDKMGHKKKWWGHVPSVPSINDAYEF